MRLLGQHQAFLVMLDNLAIVVFPDTQVYLDIVAQQVLLDILDKADTAALAVFQASVATLALAHQDILV